ncbi:MAG: ACP S-malonyltransferase [Actinomycetia bacterium]|nr:ACP S-malonyltransferase [Actinomycetes bacterium]
MGKIALIFPGQGSQYEGMGMDFITRNPNYRKYFDLCSNIIGQDILEIISGQPQQLNKTNYSQPAIYAFSCALFDYLKENTNLAARAQAVAGHSLGDYSALYAAGAYSYRKGLELVAYRCRLMAEQNQVSEGMMAAVLGVDFKRVEEQVRKLGLQVYIANYNDYTQTVISGNKQDVLRAIAEFKKNGIRKVLPLKVGVASHCPLMRRVAEELRAYMDQNLNSVSTDLPFFSSTAAEFISGKQINKILQKQLVEPVKWLPSVLELLQQGFDCWVEIGPKNILGKLTQRIIAGSGHKADVYSSDSDLDHLLNKFKE